MSPASPISGHRVQTFGATVQNVRSLCVQYSLVALQSAVCFYTNGCRQNNKRSTGMSSRGLLAMARQLPAEPFLSTHTSSTSSTSHILNFVACYSSISHIPPSPLPLPMEVEVEMPWGQVAGLQWTNQKTNSDQQQVPAIQQICGSYRVVRVSLSRGWGCTD